MMRIEFWFDPICPFCWITSRWIERVRTERALGVVWRPISLLFKNEIEPEADHYDSYARTHNLLRVVESVREAGDEDRIGDLYRAFGVRIHSRGESEFDVGDVLASVGLDRMHAGALHDDAYDVGISESMADGLALTGDDVGTPIIAIPTASGSRVGLFGPVLGGLPDLADSLALWDGFVAVVRTDGFYELKRQRHGGLEIPDESEID